MPDVAPEPPPTERQRWIAAQCLAAGEGLESAAAFAAIPPTVLRRLDAEDADFQALRDTEIARAALPAEAWARRMELLTRQAIERALADGKVSTVNALLRTGLVFPALAAPAAPMARAAVTAAIATLGTDEEDVTANEDEALTSAASPPAPEAAPDPRRAALLAAVNPVLRPMLEGARTELLEHYVAATHPDPTIYEAWFAAQSKPAFAPVPLAEEDVAVIRHVTRHNPPWLKGEYLGYYRPPVPKEAFLTDARGVPATTAPPEPPPAPAPAEGAGETLGSLQARVRRLLNRAAPRAAEELDLAEAICALKWPKWPTYHGPVDLDLLRRAFKGMPLDDDALHWLGSNELARACRAAAGPRLAQAP